AVSHADLAVHNPDKFTGLVLHKGLYRELDPSFLHRFLRRAVPTFANSVFILFETTGQGLPQRHKHLTTLSAIKIWAEMEAAAGAASDPVEQRLGVTLDEGDAAILGSMAAFVADRLAKPVDPTVPNSITAIAETAERFNDSSWFWVDDTGKSAELFAVPHRPDAYPKL